MKPLRLIRGTMMPLDRPDVDTDQILPKQFLKRIERTGYGECLFYDWAREGGEQFITNRPEYSGATVLVAGPNFGCGSSREHAVWALKDRGFEAVVAPSVADIFRSNCQKNGLLVIELERAEVDALLRLASDPTVEVTIDLESQTLMSVELRAAFDVDPSVKHRLLNGLGDIDLTLEHEPAITRFEKKRPGFMPTFDSPPDFGTPPATG